jgi:hypothetical protein
MALFSIVAEMFCEEKEKKAKATRFEMKQGGLNRAWDCVSRITIVCGCWLTRGHRYEDKENEGRNEAVEANGDVTIAQRHIQSLTVSWATCKVNKGIVIMNEVVLTYLLHDTGMLVRGVESLSLVNLPNLESLLQLRSTIQSEFDLLAKPRIHILCRSLSCAEVSSTIP